MFIKAINLFRCADVTGISDLRRPGEPAFEVDDLTGAELIALGAAYEFGALEGRTARAVPIPSENPTESVNAPDGPKTGAESQGIDLANMSFVDLKVMAARMGIKTGAIRSKSGLIEAIQNAQAEDGDEEPVEDMEPLPDLSIEDVVEA